MTSVVESVSSINSQLNLAKSKVKQLTAAHADAKKTLALAVEDDNANFDFNALKGNVTRLAREIEVSSQNVIDLEHERERRVRQQAEDDFPAAIAECAAQRKAFLENRRSACIALGKYFKARERVVGLVNRLAHATLGPLPQYANPMHSLELGNAPQESLSDLQPDWGAHWQATFQVYPMYEKNPPTGGNHDAKTV